MNNLKSILIVTAFNFLLFSCGNDSTEKTNHENETNINEENHSDEHAEEIELNNGEKWVVNEEMKPYVFRGQELITEFIKNNGSDYALLTKNLKEQNDQLIKSCTMDGKSHDELHKWLHPHLELVAELEKAANTNEAKELVLQIEKSYNVYNQYFQ